MAGVHVFSCRRRNLPPVLIASEDAPRALNVVLEELTAFVENVRPASVVWDLADNNLTFAHVQHIADKLSQLKGALRLHALDLCFNRIYVPDWKTFLPLVKQLANCVEYLEFGGNYLPAIQETSAALHDLVFEKLSLAPPSIVETGIDWVDGWSRRAATFRFQAYGVSPDM